MRTLQELKAQRAEIDTQIKEAEAASFTALLPAIIQTADDNGLDLLELSAALLKEANDRAPAPKKQKSVKLKVAPKYRHTGNGKTWTGRGINPGWFSQEAIDTGVIVVLR